MTPAALDVLNLLRTKLRRASVGTAGGFRPPEDPLALWL